ncbi:hypothetical protein P245_04350 [Comamonas thiooxydans]|uniref:Lipoprotein n=1 Tax=Comamonas thiooxydans TaxID=363952 RepID=A0A0E3BJY6_9BURK|nr:hypothetical protein [Comamonas thiooxydans]KGG98592.1 hypothetical protein P245_04350 [Comamonas thiooxydans]
MKKIALVLMTILLTACGEKSIEGTFVSNMTGGKYTFSANGTVVHANAKKTFPSQKYSVEGDAILIDGSRIGRLRLLPDGNISSDMGLLVKQ